MKTKQNIDRLDKKINQLTNKYVYGALSNEFKSDLESLVVIAQTDLITRLGEAVNNLDEMIAVTDNDSHRYQIPKSKHEEWEEFCNIPEDDERSWDVPDFAERIDGMPVSSFKDKAQSLLTTTLEEIQK